VPGLASRATGQVHLKEKEAVEGGFRYDVAASPPCFPLPASRSGHSDQGHHWRMLVTDNGYCSFLSFVYYLADSFMVLVAVS
jgi:hypothetical protein